MARASRVGIVVPAHNEERLLAACLHSLEIATAGLDARVLVVLDSCTDGTASLCRRWGVETMTVAARCVGRARAAGVARLLAGGGPPGRLWLANTDADTRVAPDWLTTQVELARAGADAVFGVVRLGGRAPLHAAHQAAYRRRIRPDGTHDHVHGASLGLSAAAYIEAGGFPPCHEHEDRLLANRLAADRRLHVVPTDRVWVETSPRLTGRSPGGFSADLAASLPA